MKKKAVTIQLDHELETLLEGARRLEQAKTAIPVRSATLVQELLRAHLRALLGSSG